MSDEAEKPEDQQNYNYCPQHRIISRLLIRTSRQSHACLEDRLANGGSKRILYTAKLPIECEQRKMRNVPFWIDSVPIKRFPRLQKQLNVDVVVVGAGITGITTAYLLKQAGLTVALIERERVASIDTGHTTAHLTYVTDLELQKLARNFGSNHAQAVWDAGAYAIDEIERIVH